MQLPFQSRKETIHPEKENHLTSPASSPPLVSDRNSDTTLTAPGDAHGVADADVLKKATKTRRHAIIASSLFFFISVIFLILVRLRSHSTLPC